MVGTDLHRRHSKDSWLGVCLTLAKTALGLEMLSSAVYGQGQAGRGDWDSLLCGVPRFPGLIVCDKFPFPPVHSAPSGVTHAQPNHIDRA